MEMQKVKMSQDSIYDYLTKHGVIISRIGELMGMEPSSVISCFKHHLNPRGIPRHFTVRGIAKLNDALQVLVGELRSHVVVFGSDKVYTNKHGRTYDPGMIEPLNELGKYMNLMSLTNRLLGWNQRKKLNVFSSPATKNYGNISESDVNAINAEVLSVAGVLEGVEVVPDDDAYDDTDSSNG